MKKAAIAALLLLSLLSVKSFAQDSPVPKNYSLKAKEDYAPYEADVIKTVDWLQKASWSEPVDVRKPSNSFVIDWISGSPNISLAVGEGVMKLAGKNPEMLVIYMGNYAKYALQHKDETSALAPTVAAIRAVIAKYQMEPTHVKDSHIEKLAQLDKDGKLEAWVKTDFK